LQDEGTKGYDVEILRLGLQPNSPGIPLFLQFKLSERIVRKRCGQPEAGYYDPPFYRVYLRTREPNQHQLLLNLKRKGKKVYYIAPGFHTTDGLNGNYAAGTVVSNSLLLCPGELGVFPTGEKHHFSFKSPLNSQVWRFSDPEKVQVRGPASIVQRHIHSLKSDYAPVLNEKFLTSIEHDLLSSIQDDQNEATLFGEPIMSRNVRERLGPLRWISYVARVMFERTFFLVGYATTE